uniref:Putative oxygenase n=1 Tax=Streptomyces sp. 2238-SVT4 TaxID=681626 RepID=D5MRI4_9ACTN|nr:putative oxygenase [Streptomyces sp. 2238-SVT4]
MGSIRVEDGYLSLFNIFHIEGAPGQDRLFETFRGLPPAKVQPGLVSGNIHRGTDGRSVLNYAQWESQAAYDAFRAETATKGRLDQALTFSRMDSVATEVVHTWQPAPRLSVDDGLLTAVVLITTTPEHQAEVLKELVQDDPALADTPGFVSDAVHRGLSGEHVVKYAQWEDEAAFRSYLGKQRSPSAVEYLISVEIHLSRLEYVRGRS